MSDSTSAGEALDYEAETVEAIALCGGDARAAVTALLVVNTYLEKELELARTAVSNGYSRGWHAKRAQGAE